MVSDNHRNGTTDEKPAQNEYWKICILGDMSVGKTALADGFLGRTFDPEEETSRSRTEDHMTKLLNQDGRSCAVQVFDPIDTDPSEPLVFHPGEGIEEADAFVLLYSVTSRGSFDRLISFHSLISAHHPQSKHKDGRPVPVILVGNMCDMDQADPNAREVTTDDGQALADKWGCKFYETSAKDMHNVDRVFSDLLRDARMNYHDGKGKEREREGQQSDGVEEDKHGECCGCECVVM
ncbi:P-loop containing nucleoside triphosphate hydrolase protein [Neolentinus lepideus HHB14362 ss-1]|uniref:small monomeric GTPase n=1 Tax=Neolentinus lepideus HHB14362 ss-1 TaxID=1314782 RepID=A0A165Q772_9AGAM|nr:P-loop containing nucleoside triphosphate hydrolase protein [Neolentinus lepideus HHB14362 ss-1]